VRDDRTREDRRIHDEEPGVCGLGIICALIEHASDRLDDPLSLATPTRHPPSGCVTVSLRSPKCFHVGIGT
jgi:hypothetical protein